MKRRQDTQTNHANANSNVFRRTLDLLLHFLAQLERELLARSVIVFDLRGRSAGERFIAPPAPQNQQRGRRAMLTFFNFFSMISLIFCSTTRGTNISSSFGFIRYDAG